MLPSLTIQSTAAAVAGLPPAAAEGADFSSQLRGTEPQPIDAQMARMAADVYNPASRGVDGWSRLGPAELAAAGIAPEALEDRTTGFRAAIYSDGQGHHTLAFAGSNDVPDWFNNLAQGLGLDAAQYRQAIALAKDARLAFGDELAITGHSLGGGLAATAALAIDSPAVTFNAAGVSGGTLRDAGLDPRAARAAAEAGQVRRYAVDGEILTAVQEDVPLLRALPDAPGHKIELRAPPLERPNNDWLDRLARPVSLHLMDAVQAALGRDQPWVH